MALSPSQRVTLVKQVADRLADEDWPLIDLTLKEFDLPTTDTWSGTKDAYLMQCVSGASDAVLMQIAAHVGYHIQGIEQPPAFEPPFWTKGHLRLFVSHLATHKAFVTELQESLSGYGICAFVAHTPTSNLRQNGKRRSRPPWDVRFACCSIASTISRESVDGSGNRLRDGTRGPCI